MSPHALRVCLAAACALSITMSAGAQTAQPAQPPARQTSPVITGTTTTMPAFELTGGYQLVHVPDLTFPFGLNLDAAWNLGPNLGLVGEVGWAYKKDTSDGFDTNFNLWHVGAGPRWEARSGGLWPFAQVLVGAANARASSTVLGEDVTVSDTKFMIQPGVGVNVLAGDGWGVVGQVDYRRVFLDKEIDGASGENEVRVFVGIRMILD